MEIEEGVLYSVVSSNIESLGVVDGEMTVKFKSGRVYSYSPASLGDLESALRSESVGKWFNIFKIGKEEREV
jgi:hypothetical protein